MRNDFKTLFSELKDAPVSTELLGRVVSRVHEESRYRQFKRSFLVYSLSGVVAVVVFIYSLTWLSTSVASSGFGDILSLIGTDFGLVASFWQNYLMSLLETAPVASFTFLLSSASLILFVIRFLMKNNLNLAKFLHLNNLSHNN